MTGAAVAAYLSIPLCRFEMLVREGLMPAPKRVGGRLVYDSEEVRLAFKALPADEMDCDGWSDVDAS